MSLSLLPILPFGISFVQYHLAYMNFTFHISIQIRVMKRS